MTSFLLGNIHEQTLIGCLFIVLEAMFRLINVDVRIFKAT
jgi:hypothetical protein